MVTKTTTRKFSFTKQELIDCLLYPESPGVTAGEIHYVSIDESDSSRITVLLREGEEEVL